VLLINAVKDVASALSDLISATKNASGKSVQDPAMLHLKESAKVGCGLLRRKNIRCLLRAVPGKWASGVELKSIKNRWVAVGGVSWNIHMDCTLKKIKLCWW